MEVLKVDRLITYPTKANIYGNIISNRLGFVETLDDFDSKQCEVEFMGNSYELAPTGILNEVNNFNIYGIKLKRNLRLYNCFSESMQYCSYENRDNVFVCEHMKQGDYVDDILYNIGIGDIFEVTEYNRGYTFTVKENYLKEFEIEIESELENEISEEESEIESGIEDEIEENEEGIEDEIEESEEGIGEKLGNTEEETEGTTNTKINVLADDVESWFLLFHDSGELEDEEEKSDVEYGVRIPENASYVNYSFDFLSSFDIEIFVGFVFFDEDGRIIDSVMRENSLINNHIGDGTLIDAENNKYRNRQQFILNNIPEGACFVSPEFKLPILIYPGQWIRINKNCILFDNPYINFVRNE